MSGGDCPTLQFTHTHSLTPALSVNGYFAGKPRLAGCPLILNFQSFFPSVFTGRDEHSLGIPEVGLYGYDLH